MAAGRQYWRPLPQDTAALLLQPPTVPSWVDETQVDPAKGPTPPYVERYGEYLAAYEQFLLARVAMRDLEMRITARDPSRVSSVTATPIMGQHPLYPMMTRPRLGMKEVRASARPAGTGAPSSTPFPPPVSSAGSAQPPPGLKLKLKATATPPQSVASGPPPKVEKEAKPSEAQLARRRAKRRRNRLSARTRRAVARTEAIKAQTVEVKAKKTLEQLRRPPRSKPAKAETEAGAKAERPKHRSPSYLRRLERRKQLRTGSS